MAKVAILLGSKSDEQVMQGCIDYLTKFGIPVRSEDLLGTPAAR